MKHEDMLRLGRLVRMDRESDVSLLRRQRQSILDARSADQKAAADALEADILRKEIQALGHKPSV